MENTRRPRQITAYKSRRKIRLGTPLQRYMKPFQYHGAITERRMMMTIIIIMMTMTNVTG
jgi:hypothetical protein